MLSWACGWSPVWKCLCWGWEGKYLEIDQLTPNAEFPSGDAHLRMWAHILLRSRINKLKHPSAPLILCNEDWSYLYESRVLPCLQDSLDSRNLLPSWQSCFLIPCTLVGIWIWEELVCLPGDVDSRKSIFQLTWQETWNWAHHAEGKRVTIREPLWGRDGRVYPSIS